jgi:hypothetical protein
MSMKESQRALTLQDVKSGVINLKEASVLLELSYPQTKRLWSKFKKQGPKGLISKKRGRPSNRAVSENQRREIADIIAKNYQGCKPLFISEKLEERHGRKFSSEFIRQLMIDYHYWIPNLKKKKIHQRRSRREREGELVQMDASDHAWFEDRGPRCHLHLLVDDASSKIYGGYFALEETTEGYFKACKLYFEKKGLPISFYTDKRGTFKVNQGNKNGETQFQRAMKELGVGMIYAHSPEAKGRIERVFGTLQERLVWEMRIANISCIEEGNKYLPKFIEQYNKKFAVEPANPFNAHRQLKQRRRLKYILCRKEQRIVSKNLEIEFENQIYQLISSDQKQDCLKKKSVDVIIALDGEVRIEFQGRRIKYKKFSEQNYREEEKELSWPTPKKKPKHSPQFRKNFIFIVKKRGYVEKEETMTSKEKGIVKQKMEKRRAEAREDNLEAASNLKDGTND